MSSTGAQALEQGYGTRTIGTASDSEARSAIKSAVSDKGKTKKLKKRCQAGTAHGIATSDGEQSMVPFRSLFASERAVLLEGGASARICPHVRPHRTNMVNSQDGQPESSVEFVNIDVRACRRILLVIRNDQQGIGYSCLLFITLPFLSCRIFTIGCAGQ